VHKDRCLLPIFIILNLFFGWIFLKPLPWLLAEAILIIVFMLNSFMISSKFSSHYSRQDNIIDVEGRALEENE